MSKMIDPHQPDADVAWKRQVRKDHDEASEFDREAHFDHESDYAGSEEALARLRARKTG